VVIGSVIVNALDRLDLRFPEVDAASLEEFKQVRKALENEDKKLAVKQTVKKVVKRVAKVG
jgi:MFS superfamily sulfate permease-like transporter